MTKNPKKQEYETVRDNLAAAIGGVRAESIVRDMERLIDMRAAGDHNAPDVTEDDEDGETELAPAPVATSKKSKK